MLARLHPRHRPLPHLTALYYLRAGGESQVMNCGYGSGFSVLDVTEAVKRAAGNDFPVRVGPRRPGDPAAIVAKADRVHDVLGWEPRYNDARHDRGPRARLGKAAHQGPHPRRVLTFSPFQRPIS